MLSYTDTVSLVCQVNKDHYEPMLWSTIGSSSSDPIVQDKLSPCDDDATLFSILGTFRALASDHIVQDGSFSLADDAFVKWLVNMVTKSTDPVQVVEDFLLKGYEANDLVAQILKPGGRLNNKYKEALVAETSLSRVPPYTRGMDARESLSVVPSSSPSDEFFSGLPAAGPAAMESAAAGLAAAEPTVVLPERTRTRTKRQGQDKEEEKEPAVRPAAAGLAAAQQASADRPVLSAWQTEKRRVRLSRMSWSKVCSALKDDELEQCFDYHYEKFLVAKPKAKGAGRPKENHAKVNWLLQQVKPGDKNLVPYILSLHDGLRSQFGLPSNEQVELSRNQLTFPKMPSVRQMWVLDPEKAPFGWSKSNKQVEGVPWK